MDELQLNAFATAVTEKIRPGIGVSRAWAPTGGVSAQVIAVETNAHERFIIRRHGSNDLNRNPLIAQVEYRLLEALHGRGIAVPEPVTLDDSCALASTPYLVVAFVDGEAEPRGLTSDRIVELIAEQLAAIHALNWSAAELAYLPAQRPNLEARASFASEHPATQLNVDAALTALRRPRTASRNAPVLLHGDFWPGNLLWRDGKIAAVIDWEDAAIGDPLADLANCRMEMLFSYGVIAMDAFTRRYVEIVPLDLSDLPYWDLFAATGPVLRLHEWGLASETERSMIERHGEFVRQALQRIAANSIHP